MNGDASRALQEWLAGRLPGTLLSDNGRRRLVQLEPAGGEPILVKHFRVLGGRRPLRDRALGRLGLSPAQREWRCLAALHRAGVPVPEPRARLEAPGGDALVAMRFVAGEPLREALAGARGAERRRLAEGVGRAVAALHAAGFAHGDLHHGNFLAGPGGVTVLDFQRTRRSSSRRARLRDLGWLDYSLGRDLSTVERVRLRAAALGLARPFGREARALLRAVAAESRLRAERHARSRTRRSLRPGRLYADAAKGPLRGLRVRELAPADLDAALAAHAAALATPDDRVLKHDGRSRITAVRAGERAVVVKESPPRGLVRAVADGWRGSAARRAWVAGHGLAARGIGAARPLAFLERRVLALPRSSLLVLEDLRPAEPADTCAELAPEAVLDALAALASALHRRGVDHGDLKASHVFVRSTLWGVEARVLDLDGVRFRGERLSDARRVQALAELNASLPDRFPAPARRSAFLRYAAGLPFQAGRDAALEGVVAKSLARRHRWSGAGCASRA